MLRKINHRDTEKNVQKEQWEFSPGLDILRGLHIELLSRS
jgi:hypothetical protein